MNKIFQVILCVLFVLSINAQSIDRIEAIIGDEIVLTSDFESQYLQYLSEGNIRSEQVRCEIIEDILFQKLLVNQAKRDSIEISDEQVESEIDKRLNYFEKQLGSIDKVEEYFGKEKIEIKIELARVIKDQFLAQKIQESIISDVKVTPNEVRDFFNNQEESDIPEVPTKIELSQIVIKPEITEDQKEELRKRLNDFRSRVYQGEDFKMLATLYSDDLGSSTEGGELGFLNRGDLVPEFERAAFRLKAGEISEVVESQFGFHIIQFIERRGEQINVRHILLKNKVSSTALYNAQLKIKSIEQEIKKGEITFEDAVAKYSDDESRNNGGLLLNPNTMSTMHSLTDLDSELRYTVNQLKIDEMSSPTIFQNPDNTKAYRVLKLNKKKEMHRANLVDDFAMIKDFFINIKKQDKVMSWIQERINNTYIKINDNITSCKFKNKWID